MKLAMVDWVLLSRTALVLSPYLSSFSEEAVVAGGMPHVQLSAQGLLLGLDVTVPGCRSHVGADAGSVMKYTLGQQCGTRMEEAWGIPDVAC
jgi:hypothetical protein